MLEEYGGGYDDWQRHQAARAATQNAAQKTAAAKPQKAPERPAPARSKLSYKDARELEALPARIDALELDKLASEQPPEANAKALDEYLGILDAFDGLLLAQAKMDLASLSAVTKRAFSDREAEAIVAAQHAAYKKTFIYYGMTNDGFAKVMRKLSPAKAEVIAERAAAMVANKGTNGGGRVVRG